MDLQEYFENQHGLGVLATADREGNVNGALYSRPHIIDGKTLAFIMNDRLTHANVLKNPKAAYIFIPAGSKKDGVRLYITMTGEDDNIERIRLMSRKSNPAEDLDDSRKRFLVFFSIDRVLPLVASADL